LKNKKYNFISDVGWTRSRLFFVELPVENENENKIEIPIRLTRSTLSLLELIVVRSTLVILAIKKIKID